MEDGGMEDGDEHPQGAGLGCGLGLLSLKCSSGYHSKISKSQKVWKLKVDID